MLAELKRFLAKEQEWPWAWGRNDCTMTVANWIAQQTGKDPAEGIRYAYHDEAGARAIIAAAGGLEALVGPRLRAIGLMETAEPKDGDVAFLDLPAALSEGMTQTIIPGIRFGRLWAVRTLAGTRVTRFEHRKAWRIA